MRLYLIRHAESENNILTPDTIHRRKVDPTLTPLGYQQRDLLAEHLATGLEFGGQAFAITRLYTSAMYRSLLTADPVAAALGLAPRVWPDLHEKYGMYLRRNGHDIGFGGMKRSEIQADFPDYHLPDAVTERGWYNAGLGREPETRSFYRAIKVAQQFQDWRQNDDAVALISHAGFLDILLKAIFAQLPSQPHAMRYYHNNTAITRIDYDGRRPILHYLNRVDHLPAALRSY